MRDIELIPADEAPIEVILYTYELLIQKRNVAQFLLSVSSAFFAIMLSLLLFAVATEKDTIAIIVITSISMALALYVSAYSIYQIARLSVGTSHAMTDIINYVKREEMNK